MTLAEKLKQISDNQMEVYATGIEVGKVKLQEEIGGDLDALSNIVNAINEGGLV